MMVRIVEKVAFDAPDFVVHLIPLRARIGIDLHPIEMQCAFAGLATTAVAAMNHGALRPGPWR